MKHVINDGGREAAGRKGDADDCVARSICIAMQRPYAEVYAELADIMARMPKTRRRNKSAGQRSARNGVYTKSTLFKAYMARLGWSWVPTMQIGAGCTVHLKAGELPPGRLVVAVSKHYTAVIDGELHDTYDCSRGGTRCVYGYWRAEK